VKRKVFKCSQCNAIIDARQPNCKFCGEKQSYESRTEFLDRQLIDINCQKCGCNKSFYATSNYFNISTCCECGAETSCKDKVWMPPPAVKTIKCPYCNSYNVKKITKSSKVAHGITFGFFAASKLVNQWHCNNCKSDF
jgi:hypothetical protein